MASLFAMQARLRSINAIAFSGEQRAGEITWWSCSSTHTEPGGEARGREEVQDAQGGEEAPVEEGPWRNDWADKLLCFIQ